MNSSNNQFDKQLVSLLKGEKTDFDISEATMHRVFIMNEQKNKRKRKETQVMCVYSGLVIIEALILFFLNKEGGILPDFHLPELNLRLNSGAEILIYYKAATIILGISLFCFVAYLTKHRIYRF